jgi:hypothetical protein
MFLFEEYCSAVQSVVKSFPGVQSLSATISFSIEVSSRNMPEPLWAFVLLRNERIACELQRLRPAEDTTIAYDSTKALLAGE